MPKRPSLIGKNTWNAAVLSACFAAFACAAPEEPEYAPPLSGGTGATGGSTASGGASGSGTAGTNVAGTATSGGSAGTGTGGSNAGSGGSSGSGGTAGSTGGSAGKGGSAGTATGGSAGKGGSSGSSGAGGSAGSSGGSAGTATGGSGGAPPTGQLFFDDFDGSNSDPWYSVDDEGMPISGWELVMDGTTVFKQSSASSDPSWAIGGNATWTDQVVEVKLKFDDVPDESAAALVAARFTSFDAYYYLELRGDGGIKIRKRVNGSTGDVTRYDPDVPLAGGTWYTVGIGAVGSTLTAYFNGAAVATGTDTDVPQGGIGIGTTEEAIVAFDDVRVTAP